MLTDSAAPTIITYDQLKAALAAAQPAQRDRFHIEAPIRIEHIAGPTWGHDALPAHKAWAPYYKETEDGPVAGAIALARDGRILLKPNATADVFAVSLNAIVTAVTNALEGGSNDQLYARCAYLWIREYRPADDSAAEAAWRMADSRAYDAIEEYGPEAAAAILAFGRLVADNRIDAGGRYISEEEEQALIVDDLDDLNDLNLDLPA
jgi:hypothetical protein